MKVVSASVASIASHRIVLMVNLTVKGFRHPISDFYRQTRFEYAQEPANSGVFRAPNRLARQFIGFFAESHVNRARLIRCVRGFQRYAITQTPRVVACRLPKFVRALRSFLSLAVTKPSAAGKSLCLALSRYLAPNGKRRLSIPLFRFPESRYSISVRSHRASWPRPRGRMREP
jgi:hypothetical protein